MGTWGVEPWQNDAAANWTDSLFQLTRLDLHVEETLHLSVAEFTDEVRAAVAVLMRLVEIWPVESRRRCLPLALAQLERAAQLRALAPLQDAVRQEIAAVQALLPRDS